MSIIERRISGTKLMKTEYRWNFLWSSNLFFICWILGVSTLSGLQTTKTDQSSKSPPSVNSLLLGSHQTVDRDNHSLQNTGLPSIRLIPPQTTLWGTGASQQFRVVEKFKNGVERDITSDTRFSLANSQLATVSNDGHVRALANGTTILKAKILGQIVRAEVRTEASQQKKPLSFKREIGGVLTKSGCNNTDCHGGVKGKGGLKLSIDALYPREDYKWISEGGGYQVLTNEAAGEKIPRINLKEPRNSLLLLKATGAVHHGGGQLFNLKSPEYKIILDWIRRGAPYEREGSRGFEIEYMEVFPNEAVLQVNGERQLLVTAHLVNGQQEDFTHQVRYTSANSEVVEITEKGLVFAIGPGETGVTIRAAGQAINTRFGVIKKTISDYPEITGWNFIDDHVFTKLRKFHILPSELSSDEEFLRRVCLDITGTLPPPERVREFLASQDPKKRGKLIDTLLATPEYIEYWTFRFADILRVGSGVTGPDDDGYWEWIRDSITQNKPYDVLMRQRLAAQGYDGPSRFYLRYGKVPPIENIVAEQMRILLGRRIDCSQCHNHPYETWSQDQFWGLAAFFGGMKATAWEGPNQVIYDDSEGQEVDYPAIDVTLKTLHPRTGEEITPTFLDGRMLATGHTSPRNVLGEWITSHPYFSEAGANRIWGYFFGRGIVDPVDDFRLTAPPTHPGLLKALATDFQEHQYDLKHLIKMIVSSRTYQLSSTPNQTNQNDEINYSHTRPQPLDAEILLDAISMVTGVPEKFKGSDGGEAPWGERSMNLRDPVDWPSRFLEIHGRPLRQELPERDTSPTLAQALHRLVGPTYTGKLSTPGGRLYQLLGKALSDKEIIEELYLATLTRYPSKEEQLGLEKLISGQPTRKQGFENLLWALISSREFVHKH